MGPTPPPPGRIQTRGQIHPGGHYRPPRAGPPTIWTSSRRTLARTPWPPSPIASTGSRKARTPAMSSRAQPSTPTRWAEPPPPPTSSRTLTRCSWTKSTTSRPSPTPPRPLLRTLSTRRSPRRRCSSTRSRWRRRRSLRGRSGGSSRSVRTRCPPGRRCSPPRTLPSSRRSHRRPTISYSRYNIVFSYLGMGFTKQRNK